MAGLSAILMLPGLALAQTIRVQQGVKVGRVYVTGENPGIRLLDKEGGTVLTAVSYWRLIWSPAGPGHIAFVTTGDGKSPGDLRLAFVDNRKLYDFLTREITTMIDPTFTARPYTIIQAKFVDSGQGTFSPSGDSMTERKVTFQGAPVQRCIGLARFLRAFSGGLAGEQRGAEPVRRHLAFHSGEGCGRDH